MLAYNCNGYIPLFFCNSQCILSRICHKKNGCTQTVTVSTKLRTVSPSPFFIRCKTVCYEKLEAVVNLVGADFKQKRKDKAFKYYDIKGKGFKVYFV